jgi:hypothetical protein
MSVIMERVRAFFREHPVTTERKANQYLTEHMPRLTREYKLATVKDSAPVDEQISSQEAGIADLLAWRDGTEGKLAELRKRTSRLEMK